MSIRNAVVVLGAGASKGARVAGGRTPPLDSDFLTVASDYFARKQDRGKHRAAVLAWRSFQRHLNGAGLRFSEVKSWRLEQLSTFLEARASLRGIQLTQGRPRNYAAALDALKILVCYVLKAEGGTHPCTLHAKLFSLVNPRAVITFNYDLIADQSLLELGRLNWRGRDYRGASFARIPAGRKKKYQRISGAAVGSAPPLLKLHGSMNWEALSRGDGYRLAGAHLPNSTNKLLEFVEVPFRPYIVPPVAAKIQIAQATLRERWKTAVDQLHRAPLWIIWGYSFPGTDTISQVLFRTALANNRMSKPVVVVNPDASVAQRVKTVCRKVSVQHYPSMKRFLVDHKAIPLTLP